MAVSKATLGKTLFWGALSAALYGFLFYFADEFVRLAQTTQNVCVVQTGTHMDYYSKATQELCAAKGGRFVEGTWWYVFAPILMAFAISFVHGNFTGLFWDLVGLKAKK